MSTRVRTPDEYRPFIDLVDRVGVLANEDPITYRRIRLHLPKVQEWFATRAGWSVVATREVVRLIKTPARPTSGLGIRSLQSPLDYELLVWVLWYGERNETEQFLLSELIEEIAHQANTAIGSDHIDWVQYPQRQALRRALSSLEEAGALRRLDGSLEDWANDRTGNTLYEFTALAPHLGVETTAATHAVNASDEIRLYRTLLLEPIVYSADDPAAFATIGTRDRRKLVADDFREHFGWDLEVSDVHAALLRPSASEATEQALFPFRAAISHPVLLLCAAFREHVAAGTLQPDADQRISISKERIESELALLSSRVGANWGATIRQLALPRLAQQVIDVMSDWSLMHGPTSDGLYVVLPAAARFRATYVDSVADEGTVA